MKRRIEENYHITEQENQQFADQGYLVLPDVLTEEECNSLDPWFDHFISGAESQIMKKDFCDMSQPYGTPIEEFQLVNAINPSLYKPDLKNNIFHRVSQSIAKQLYYPRSPEIDYEQFLAKKPTKKKAEFAMHQDLGYWPMTDNTWTATFSLALTDSDIINGCLYVIPGSNKENELRKHVPASYDSNQAGSRDDSHTLVIEALPTDNIIHLPVKRGSVTIHDERIVHGSGGNNSEIWRKTYVVAYRDPNTIEYERSIGFTHSHNDTLDWKNVLTKH